MEPAILAQGLTKRFNDLTAVDGIDLQVHPHEIFGLVGPDGAGKTTFLRMLSSIMEPSSGTAKIAGFDTSDQASRVKDNLAYMSQRFGLYTDLSVWENVDFYADLYGVPRKGRKEHIEELLDFSYMLPFRKRLAGDLSGGMKQKLQLVCALVHTPKVLLLDEPTNGVDPVSRRDFWRILYRLLKSDVAILVSTAYLDEAERCSRVGLISHGKLLAQGSPGEVKSIMKGSIVSIRSAQARAIKTLLADALDCTGINVFGDTVHVVTEDAGAIHAQAVGILSKKGLAYDEIHIQEPTLEDVFVGVLEEKSAEHEPAMSEAVPVIADNTLKGDGNSAVTVHELTRR
ncbi:MAG TPA: ABC transporter ATP-binding protein, partial [Deltaproteobacteria bacterium]|nr:ABC transporter ATP-binding protein [Deltaproteobacteria bacterium]